MTTPRAALRLLAVVAVAAGPGVADLAGDAASFGQLAGDGWDVYPDHVAKLIFSSPGALAPALDDGSGGGVRGRLTRARQPLPRPGAGAGPARAGLLHLPVPPVGRRPSLS